jgi:hypothetical protein
MHADFYEAMLVHSSSLLELIHLLDYCIINSLGFLVLHHFVLSFYISRYVVLCPASACRCGNSPGLASLSFDQLKRRQRTFCPLSPDLPRLSEAINPGDVLSHDFRPVMTRIIALPCIQVGATVEDEMASCDTRSNNFQSFDGAAVGHPETWSEYGDQYQGDASYLRVIGLNFF